MEEDTGAQMVLIGATLLIHRILAFDAEHVTIQFVSRMETVGELLERKDGV